MPPVGTPVPGPCSPDRRAALTWAADLLDRLDHLPAEMLDRMHGAIRYPSVRARRRVARNSLVRMQPGSRRADAQDLFLAGREAIVEAVLFDVDGWAHLAVTPVDDPAADLQRSHGRFLNFAPAEVCPLPGPATPETAGTGDAGG